MEDYVLTLFISVRTVLAYTLVLTPCPSWIWFNLWYRPIYEARRLTLVRLLTGAFYPSGVDVLVHNFWTKCHQIAVIAA